MSAAPTRSALVTGAGRRIGAALARALGREGHHVLVHYNRSGEEAEAVAAAIRGEGGSAEAVGADLAEAGARAALIPSCLARGAPPLAILVNNASVFEHDTLAGLDPALFRRQMEINALAPFDLARALAAHLPPQERGVVVTILDQKLWNLHPDFFSYTISKYAAWGGTQLMARALAPRIRVGAVAPGLILRSGDQTDEDFARAQGRNALARANRVEDVVAAVLYIIRAESVTGQAILVDGGEHLQPPDPAVLASKAPAAGE